MGKRKAGALAAGLAPLHWAPLPHRAPLPACCTAALVAVSHLASPQVLLLHSPSSRLCSPCSFARMQASRCSAARRSPGAACSSAQPPPPSRPAARARLPLPRQPPPPPPPPPLLPSPPLRLRSRLAVQPRHRPPRPPHPPGRRLPSPRPRSRHPRRLLKLAPWPLLPRKQLLSPQLAPLRLLPHQHPRQHPPLKQRALPGPRQPLRSSACRLPPPRPRRRRWPPLCRPRPAALRRLPRQSGSASPPRSPPLSAPPALWQRLSSRCHPRRRCRRPRPGRAHRSPRPASLLLPSLSPSRSTCHPPPPSPPWPPPRASRVSAAAPSRFAGSLKNS